jgi:hypothetical protein
VSRAEVRERATVPEEVLDGYVPPPYVPPATLDERLVKVWREVTRTPGRAALATLDLCALVALIVALHPIPVTTADARGALHARCGIAFYVAGASNRAVDAACHYAYASRAPIVVFLGLVVLAGIGLLVLSIARPAPAGEPSRWRRGWDAVTRTPGRAALATFDVAVLVAAVISLSPVNRVIATSSGPVRAHCGLRFFVLGVGDSAIRDACRSAYGPRGTFFFIALAVLIGGVATLARLIRRPSPETPAP